MHAPLSSDKQKYYQLMALVCEDLTTAAIDALVRAGHKASSAQLTAVRQARKIHLPWLIDLVEVELIDFQIPAELRPANSLVAATSLFQV